MKCIFDQCEFYNGLFLGIIASLIASFITLVISQKRIIKKNKRKFGKAEGIYDGFGFQDTNDSVLQNNPQSKAQINYIKENILKITLSDSADDPKYEWSGKIIMELENYGTIAWKYDKYNGNSQGRIHKFGFKRLIINETRDHFYIYLVEENLEGGEKYKREVLIKDNS